MGIPFTQTQILEQLLMRGLIVTNVSVSKNLYFCAHLYSSPITIISGKTYMLDSHIPVKKFDVALKDLFDDVMNLIVINPAFQHAPINNPVRLILCYLATKELQGWISLDFCELFDDLRFFVIHHRDTYIYGKTSAFILERKFQNSKTRPDTSNRLPSPFPERSDIFGKLGISMHRCRILFQTLQSLKQELTPYSDGTKRKASTKTRKGPYSNRSANKPRAHDNVEIVENLDFPALLKKVAMECIKKGTEDILEFARRVSMKDKNVKEIISDVFFREHAQQILLPAVMEDEVEKTINDVSQHILFNDEFISFLGWAPTPTEEQQGTAEGRRLLDMVYKHYS
jgi:hypothetical protein